MLGMKYSWLFETTRAAAFAGSPSVDLECALMDAAGDKPIQIDGGPEGPPTRQRRIKTSVCVCVWRLCVCVSTQVLKQVNARRSSQSDLEVVSAFASQLSFVKTTNRPSTFPFKK